MDKEPLDQVSYEASTGRRDLQRWHSVNFWSGRTKEQDLLSKFMFAGQDVPGPQNSLLRCRAVPILYTHRNRSRWMSFCGLLFKGTVRLDSSKRHTWIPTFWLHRKSNLCWTTTCLASWRCQLSNEKAMDNFWLTLVICYLEKKAKLDLLKSHCLI